MKYEQKSFDFWKSADPYANVEHFIGPEAFNQYEHGRMTKAMELAIHESKKDSGGVKKLLKEGTKVQWFRGLELAAGTGDKSKHVLRNCQTLCV